MTAATTIVRQPALASSPQPTPKANSGRHDLPFRVPRETV